jgi:2-amino-4-hydroxy-6-hydroxymethyldihydropteridine diphosphokinase
MTEAGRDDAPGRHRAYVGLGANLGDPHAAIASALAAIEALPDTRLAAVSSLYRSAPLEAAGPDFVNAVACVETDLSPQVLLAALQAIETGHGRARPHRNAPRTLDLDLLLYDALVLDAPGLQLPHPRMHQRAFVLRPLAEIAPDATLPGRAPLAALLRDCAAQRIERLGPTP